MRYKTLKQSFVALLTIGLIQFNGVAQNTNMPSDYLTTVNGAQDNFDGPSLSTNWVFLTHSDGNGLGTDNYAQAGGMLSVNTMDGNPNHLAYVGGIPYNTSTQEVLIRIRIDNMPIDQSGNNLAGAAVAINTNLSADSGVNWMLTGGPATGYYTPNGILANVAGAGFLYDYTAYGPAYEAGDMPWQIGTWYWMRLNMNGFASGNGGAIGNFSAKVWLADGSEAEPEDWQVTWTNVTANGGANNMYGYVGIKNGSDREPCQFDVDYFLVKASGLPSITISPLTNNPTTVIAINTQPQGTTVGPSQTASFSVSATGSSPLTYQWQTAPAANPAAFANVSGGTGGTTSNYITGSLSIANNGDQFRVLVSIGSTVITSSPATLTIDATPPTLLWAKTLNSSNSVTLQFSEPVKVPADASGFSINNGVTVTAVSAGPENDRLVVSSSTLSLGASYILSAAGVSDSYANVLAATNVPISFALAVPLDYGLSVSGYQDSFSGPSLDPDWVPVGLGVDTNFNGGTNYFVQADGVLHVGTPPFGNPNHLVYAAQGYNSTTQEVLMRMRITAFVAATNNAYSDGDSTGGPTVGCNTNESNPIYGTTAGVYDGGINMPIVADTNFNGSIWGDPDGTSDPISGPQIRFLDDIQAWQGGYSIPFVTTNVWYWLRLGMVGNYATNGPNILGKIWLGDGSEDEPADWQLTWQWGGPPYGSPGPGRSGYAAIGAATFQEPASPETGVFNFDVGYFLVKASGLPTITIAPSLGNFGTLPVTLTLTRGPGNITLTWPGTATLQSAPAVTGPWTAVAGAPTSPYTTSPAATTFYRLH